MKKFLVGLMAFLGMAVCFTACGSDEEKQADPSESGTSLYDSYVQYKSADETTQGTVAKAEAALNLYNAYEAYTDNKDDNEWIKQFASSAALAALGVDAEEDAKEQVTNKLLEKLQDGSLVDENSGNKIVAVAELATALSDVFGTK